MNSHIETWLRSVTSNLYRFSEVVVQDIGSALLAFPGLRPKLDTYVTDQGGSLQLLALDGTIPISYKSATYNIPILVWIPLTYPEEPIFAFVKPTTTMVVKPTRHVDVNGRIYHPYLAGWKSGDRKNIIQFLGFITENFSSEPPVYSRPAGSSQPTTPQQQPYTPAPYPLPGRINNGGTGSPATFPRPSGSSGGYGAPPIPPYPNKPNSALPYPPTQPFSSLPRPQPGSPPHMSSGPSTPPQLQYRPTVSQQQFNPGPSPAARAKAEEEQLFLVQMKSDLFEKLTRRWRDESQAMMQAIEKQMSNSAKLNESSLRVGQMIRQLQAMEGQYQVNIDKVISKNQELEKYLETVSVEPELDLDNDLRGATPIMIQLVDTVAEEHALEDTIYQLTKAVGTSTPLQNDPSQWIKMIRHLAREQFMKKALVLKIQSVLSAK